MREQLTKHGKSLKGMSAKLTEMMVEAATCNNFQVTVLANTQEEPHVKGRIEAFEAQLQSVMDTSQWMEQEEESQPLDDSLLVDIDVEKVDKSEDVKNNAFLELGHILVLILNTFRHCD
ncbi:hypothetical protein HAX54_051486 [Datura stramonium]|uniref:Uncharacterized protein n=1 Tax=Datura stramonium TaxID=4076 RepID=A0ABS8SY67_DATST|nr:hypothetical protein [Datura stramonium]